MWKYIVKRVIMYVYLMSSEKEKKENYLLKEINFFYYTKRKTKEKIWNKK